MGGGHLALADEGGHALGLVDLVVGDDQRIVEGSGLADGEEQAVRRHDVLVGDGEDDVAGVDARLGLAAAAVDGHGDELALRRGQRAARLDDELGEVGSLSDDPQAVDGFFH